MVITFLKSVLGMEHILVYDENEGKDHAAMLDTKNGRRGWMNHGIGLVS